MWTFARTSGPGPQFTVIGGYFVKRSGETEESASVEPDKSGAVVRLTDGHCDLIGAARDVFDYPPADMPAAKLKELANDAVCRYSRAFGAYQKLIAALKRQHIESSSLSLILKDAFFAPSNPSNPCSLPR